MDKINKLFGTNICLTSRKTLLVILVILLSTIVLASIAGVEEVKEVKTDKEMWIPTKEDIEYQDSMWSIINKTQDDVTIIKKDIDKIIYKLDRLEYPDGTSDSIRIQVRR